MTSLVEFLTARLGEDEAAAIAAREGGDYVWAEVDYYSAENETHGHRWRPARVLADVDAKRRIVAALDLTPCPCARSERCVLHDRSAGPPEFAVERYADPVTDIVLRALAVPHADHADYDERWRP